MDQYLSQLVYLFTAIFITTHDNGNIIGLRRGIKSDNLEENLSTNPE